MSIRPHLMLMAAFVLGGLVMIGAFVADAAPGCNASAFRPWTPSEGRVYRAEAFANGPSCRLAAVTLVVRAPDGTALWVDAAPAAHLMTFAEVKTRKQMTHVLGDWVSQSHMFKTTAELPEWKEGDDTPKSGEFQFIPDAGVDREFYEQTRAAKSPVFCYVQGMESMSCVALSKDGQMTKIGVQTFPG